MPIIKTDPRTGETQKLYVGRVVKVDSYQAVRNVSDTLDYSDYQTVQVTEALVYVGRKGAKYEFMRLMAHEGKEVPSDVEVIDLPIQDRFTRIDCSNLFTWRGADHLRPEVDSPATLLLNGELLEDLEAYEAYNVEKARLAKIEQERAAEERRKAKEEQERNRPVKGKRMVVVRGRKVPVGTQGTVAFVSGDGRVLLKKDSEWQDRNAQGVWVSESCLKAR